MGDRSDPAAGSRDLRCGRPACAAPLRRARQGPHRRLDPLQRCRARRRCRDGVCAIALTVAGARQKRRSRRPRRLRVLGHGGAPLPPRPRHARASSFDAYGVAAFTGGATLPVGGAILALGALSALRRPAAVRPLLWLLAAGVVFVLGLGATAIARSDARAGRAGAARARRHGSCSVAGLAFYGILFWRALRTYRLTQRRADLVVAVGIVWLAAALPAALLLDYRDLGWWLGHVFEIVGIAAVGFTVAHDLRRGAARSRPLLGDLRAPTSSPRRRRSSARTSARSSSTLAEKDAYTEEHTRRVALRAVQVGDELGLAPERQRELALGGLLHDVGKLSVPDGILKKPGSLTDDEFAEVRHHVEAGDGAPARAGWLLGDGAPARPEPSRAARRVGLSGRGAPTSSRSTSGSSPSATSTTRSSRRVSTATRGRTSARSRFLRDGAGDGRSTRRCVEALERVLARSAAPTSRSPSSLAAQVGEIRLRVDRAADRPLDGLGGRRACVRARRSSRAATRAARRTRRARSAPQSVGIAALASLPDLNGEHGSEEVRREVAEAAARPVRVLEDAVRVVRHRDAHELLEARVPRVRQVLHGESARHELLLELEAEDDVEPVARLVGVDADERAPHPVDRAVEVLERNGAERTGERLLESRVEPAPERERAADDVLPEPAL